MRFISENPRSHSEVVFGSMFSVIIRLEDVFRVRKFNKLSNSDNPNLHDTFLTSYYFVFIGFYFKYFFNNLQDKEKKSI